MSGYTPTVAARRGHLGVDPVDLSRSPTKLYNYAMTVPLSDPVLGPGTERVHDVLLRFPDGSALQDTPTAGVVLFLGEGAQDLDAAEVVIRDDRGQVLARHQAQ